MPGLYLCRETDVVLSQLAAAMPVDVMPGGSDPTNHSLPQQPLHGCLLPGSGGFATMNRWAGWCVRRLLCSCLLCAAAPRRPAQGAARCSLQG